MLSRSRLLILCVVACSFFAAQACPIIYLSSDGDDFPNPGTLTSPVKTFARAVEIISASALECNTIAVLAGHLTEAGPILLKSESELAFTKPELNIIAVDNSGQPCEGCVEVESAPSITWLTAEMGPDFDLALSVQGIVFRGDFLPPSLLRGSGAISATFEGITVCAPDAPVSSASNPTVQTLPVFDVETSSTGQIGFIGCTFMHTKYLVSIDGGELSLRNCVFNASTEESSESAAELYAVQATNSNAIVASNLHLVQVGRFLQMDAAGCVDISDCVVEEYGDVFLSGSGTDAIIDRCAFSTSNTLWAGELIALTSVATLSVSDCVFSGSGETSNGRGESAYVIGADSVAKSAVFQNTHFSRIESDVGLMRIVSPGNASISMNQTTFDFEYPTYSRWKGVMISTTSHISVDDLQIIGGASDVLDALYEFGCQSINISNLLLKSLQTLSDKKAAIKLTSHAEGEHSVAFFTNVRIDTCRTRGFIFDLDDGSAAGLKVHNLYGTAFLGGTLDFRGVNVDLHYCDDDFCSQEALFMAQELTFQDVTSTASAGRFAWANRLTIKDASFTYLFAGVSDVVLAVYSLVLDNVRGSNIAVAYSFADVTKASDVVIRDCSFHKIDSQSEGGILRGTASSKVLVESSIFTSCTSKLSGGVVHLTGEYGFWKPPRLDVQVRDCEFSQCSGTYGAGAIYLRDYRTLTVAGSTFTDCKAGVAGSVGSGGALAASTDLSLPFVMVTSDLRVEGCHFVRCRAGQSGGAIFHDLGPHVLGSTVITDSEFLQLESGEKGGAVYGGWHMAMSLHNCSFEGSSSDDGGGVYMHFAPAALSASVEDCRFIGNAARSSGGGLVLNRPGDVAVSVLAVTVLASEFVGNSAFINGGGIDLELAAPNAGHGSAAAAAVSVGNATFAQNNAVANGGGLYALGGTFAVENVTFVNNTSVRGAGFSSTDGATLLSGSVFEGNAASGRGGGMLVEAGAVDTTGTLFRDNYAQEFGGAVFLSQATAGVEHSHFTGNGAGAFGGALYYDLAPSVELRTAVFEGNSAGHGGAVYAGRGSQASLLDSVFRDSTALDGGSVAVQALSHTRFDNCSFEGSLSNDTGGAISNAGAVEVLGSSFAQCRSAVGGALYSTGTARVAGSHFARNSADSGGSVSHRGGTGSYTGTHFEGSRARFGDGGSVLVAQGAAVDISGCEMVDSVSMGAGGGVASDNGKLTIVDSVFRRGEGSSGGSLFIRSRDETLVRNSSFAGFTSVEGGSIFFDIGRFSAEAVTVANSSSLQGGGGLAVGSGAESVSIRHSSFVNCTADTGGAINSRAVVLAVLSSTFAACQAAENGGFIYAGKGTVNATIDGSVFADASASVGGCLSLDAQTAVVSNSSLRRCAAYQVGGCISSTPTSTAAARLVVSASTLDRCTAEVGSGGAVYATLARAEFAGCNVTRGVAGLSGGGLALLPPSHFAATHYAAPGYALTDTRLHACVARRGDGGAAAVRAPVTANVTLRGVRVTGCAAERGAGGGLAVVGFGDAGGRCTQGTGGLALSGCSFGGCRARRGGGVDFAGCGGAQSVWVAATNFTACSAVEERTPGGGAHPGGGALACAARSVSLTRVQAQGCAAGARGDGGAVYAVVDLPAAGAQEPPPLFAEAGGVFADNSGGRGGAVAVVTASNDASLVQEISLSFAGSAYANNSAGEGGDVYVVVAGGGGYAVEMADCAFARSSAARGGAVHLSRGEEAAPAPAAPSAVRIRRCVFTSCSARSLGGGAVYLAASAGNVSLEACRFRNCSAAGRAGGAVAVDLAGSASSQSDTGANREAHILMASSQFEGCSAGQGGAVAVSGDAAFAARASLVVRNDTFTRCTAVAAAGSVRRADGGAIFFRAQSPSMHVFECQFSGNNARYGGCLAASITTDPFLFQGCNCSDNRASERGGVAYVLVAARTLAAHGAALVLSNITGTRNSCGGGYGSILHWDIDEPRYGADIDVCDALTFKYENSTFRNCSQPAFSSMALVPRVECHTVLPPDLAYLDSLDNSSQHYQPHPASGMRMPVSLLHPLTCSGWMEDCVGVSRDWEAHQGAPTYKVVPDTGGGPQAAGDYRNILDLFEGFSVSTGGQRANTSLNFKLSAPRSTLDPRGRQANSSVLFGPDYLPDSRFAHVLVSAAPFCDRGERPQSLRSSAAGGGVSFRCAACEERTVSLMPVSLQHGAQNCAACVVNKTNGVLAREDAGRMCAGSTLLRTQKPYWRASAFSSDLFRCTRPLLCLDETGGAATNGTPCAEGAANPLCAACADGWGVVGDTCIKCRDGWSWGYVLDLLPVVVNVFSVVGFVASANSPRSKANVLVRQLTNHFQMLTLLPVVFGSLGLETKKAVRTSLLPFYECKLQNLFGGLRWVYFYFTLLIATPVVLLLVYVVSVLVGGSDSISGGSFQSQKASAKRRRGKGWAVELTQLHRNPLAPPPPPPPAPSRGPARKKKVAPANEVKETPVLFSVFFGFLYTLYIYILASIFALLRYVDVNVCETAEECAAANGNVGQWTRYLLSDMRVEWSDANLAGVFRPLAVAGLAVYGVILPVWMSVHLFRKRKLPAHKSLTPGLSLVYAGYQRKYCYWEGFVITRKVLAAASAVLALNPEFQSFLLLLVCLMTLLLQAWVKPFTGREMNRVEVISVIALSVTFLAQLSPLEVPDQFLMVLNTVVHGWVATIVGLRLVREFWKQKKDHEKTITNALHKGGIDIFNHKKTEFFQPDVKKDDSFTLTKRKQPAVQFRWFT